MDVYSDLGRVPLFDVTMSTVYTLDGRTPALYVRTEQQPGMSAPQHLFMYVRERMVYTAWREEMPDEADLIIDAPSREELNLASWEVVLAKHERDFAMHLVRKACEWLPASKVSELRGMWREQAAVIS